MRRVTVVGAILVVLVAMLALTGIAVASHAPTARERAGVGAAVKHSALVPAAIHRGHFRLRTVLVSSQGPWARATIQPTGAASRRLDPVLALFTRAGRGWRIVVLGTAGVGCGRPRLSPRIRRDLRLSCS